MLNLLGYSQSMDEITRVAQIALNVRGASVHLYGKRECRKGRKMGHITIVGDSDAAVHTSLRPLLQALVRPSLYFRKRRLICPSYVPTFQKYVEFYSG